MSVNRMQQQCAGKVLPTTPGRIIMLQTVVLLLTALVACYYGVSIASSVALGGLAALLPNGLFAILFFSRSRTRSGSSIIALFYLGEVMKLLLTALLTVLFFTYFSLNLIAVLVGLALVSMSMLFAPLMPACCVRQGS